MFCSEQLYAGLYKGVSAIALSAIGFVAVGCAAGGGISSTLTAGVPVPTVTTPPAKPGHITGLVHGGQQPITGATVQMWAAGTTTGYGAGAVAVGSAVTTDSNGNFDLNPGGGGSSACLNGQLNYITATGGSSQGAGGTVNSAAALMLALPALCNKVITGGLSIVISEVTTVASVWALQQFISITPANGPYAGSAVPWQIGTDSGNVIGITNAFAQVSQLVNIATGQSANSTLTSTVTGNSFVPTLTFTTTIVPDANRIYIVADILAACINTANNSLGNNSLTCSFLFYGVTANGGGGLSPTDTIQAAYDIATAPGGITEYNTTGYNGATVPAGTSLNTPGAGGVCSSVGCEWALQLCQSFVTATPPFPPTQACSQGSTTAPSYPTDYAIGVQWSAVDSNGLTYGQEMGAIAVDGNGNIWTGNTGISPGTGYPLVEWSPQGFVMQVVGGTFTMPSSVPNGVFVTSTSGTPNFNGGLAGGSYNFSFSTPPMVPLAPGTSPFTPYGLSIDYENRLYAADYGAGVVGGAALTSGGQSFYPGLVLGIPTTTSVISGATATSTATTPTPYISGSYPGPIAVGNVDYGGGLWVGSNPQTGSDLGGSLSYIYMGTGGEETEETLYEGQYVTGGFDQILIDGLIGNAWGIPSTNTPGGTIYRNSTCISTICGSLSYGSTFSGSVGAPTNAYLTSLNISGTNYSSAGSTPLIPSWGALDQLSNLWVGEGPEGVSDGRLGYLPTGFNDFPPTPPSTVYGVPPPPPTVYIASTNGIGAANDCTGGLQNPISIAVDGLGNVFAANGVSVGERGDVIPGSGISEFTGSGTPLSPTNYPAPSSETSNCSGVGAGMPAFGFNQDNTFSGIGANLTIDSSGNLWPGPAGDMGSQAVVHMVGLAAPVAAPASAVYPGINPITAWSSSMSTCGPSTPMNPYYTITFTVPNNFKAPQSISEGQYVLLFGFGSGPGSFLINQQVQVLTATSTQFTACIAGGMSGEGSSSGIGAVQYSLLGNRP